MITSNDDFKLPSNLNTSNTSSDSLTSFCQNAASESHLQRYQLQEHNQDIETLMQRVQHLELHKATQIGQDKIVGFLVGAVVLSLISIVTTFFFKMPQVPQPSTQGAVPQSEVART